MRIFLSLAAMGLGISVIGIMVAAGRFDLWMSMAALLLLGGGLRIWRRHQILDDEEDEEPDWRD